MMGEIKAWRTITPWGILVDQPPATYGVASGPRYVDHARIHAMTGSTVTTWKTSAGASSTPGTCIRATHVTCLQVASNFMRGPGSAVFFEFHRRLWDLNTHHSGQFMRPKLAISQSIAPTPFKPKTCF